MKKPSKVDTPDGDVPPHAPGGPGWTKCPKVLEWLTAARYEDGSPRKAGWLCLSAEAGVWKVLMKEPSAGLLIRVEVRSLDLLWPTLEVVLSEKTVPWQADPRADTPKPRKRNGGA